MSIRKHTPVKIGPYTLPKNLETRSFSAVGEPGVGKTQLFHGMLSAYRDRGTPIFAVDTAGELCCRHWQRGDLLFSPVIKGSFSWSPFAEIREESDCQWLAQLTIPSGVGESAAWCGYAQEAYASILVELLKRGKTRNRDLVEATQFSSIEELGRLLNELPIRRQFERGSERMLSSVLSVMTNYLSPLSLLDPNAGQQSTSIREWASGGHQGRSLWLPYFLKDKKALQPLHLTLVSILISTMLDLPENPRRRLVLSLDELAACDVIDLLPEAVARGRKHGLVVLLGYQNMHQLFHLYGQDRTKAMLGSVGHCAILRTPDAETSDYLSQQIGEYECLEKEVSTSSHGEASKRWHRVLRRAVIPGEISNLHDRRGYLKVASVGWTTLTVPLIERPKKIKLVRKPSKIYRHKKGNGISASGSENLDAI